MNTFNNRFAGIQNQGGRDYQEDDFGVLDGSDFDSEGAEHTLLIVADGMGGHVGGAAASNIVVKSFIESYQDQGQETVAECLRVALDLANENIEKAVEENFRLKGMGTTAVAVVINKRGLEWISVGDSPMWLYRTQKLENPPLINPNLIGPQLIRLNADHSLGAVFMAMAEMGKMDLEDAKTDSNRHQLRSAISGGDIHLIDQSSQPVAIYKSDVLIVASDGIHTLSEPEIIQSLQQSADKTLTEQADDLLKAVKDAGDEYQDNITLLLYKPEQDYGEETQQTRMINEKEVGKIAEKNTAKGAEKRAENDPNASELSRGRMTMRGKWQKFLPWVCAVVIIAVAIIAVVIAWSYINKESAQPTVIDAVIAPTPSETEPSEADNGQGNANDQTKDQGDDHDSDQGGDQDSDNPLAKPEAEAAQSNPTENLPATTGLDSSAAESDPSQAEFDANYLTGKFNPNDHADFSEIASKYAAKEKMIMRTDAYTQFIKMYEAAKKDGVSLKIISATRTFNNQKLIWESKWNGKRDVNGIRLPADMPPKMKAEMILSASSMPGTSRHHWGTDVDLYSLENSDFDSGEGQKIYAWLVENAADYGFCQVYSHKGEQGDLRNGYMEEKWHWSYLPVARELTNLYKAKLDNKDISGFIGWKTAEMLDIKTNYVLGINPACKTAE